MYTLRIIEEERLDENSPFDQITENFELGEAYSTIKNGTKEFDRIMKETYPDENVENIDSLVCADNGNTFFVFKRSTNKVFSYFIMTENGKTLEKL